MPLSTTEFLIPDRDTRTFVVALEPAQNVQHSLVLLAKADDVSGFDEWIYRTAAAMTPDERAMNELVMIGFYYATIPDAGYPSFPAYLEALSATSPVQLRNKVLDAYTQIAMEREGEEGFIRPDYDEVLSDIHAFFAFLRRGFDDDHIKADLERRAYTYLIDPPALRELIVGHLRSMWYKYMAVEWERVRPTLQKAVRAFDEVDLQQMTRQEAIEYVVGRPLGGEAFCEMIESYERIVFVPSTHVGPYAAKIFGEDQLWLIFGARRPEGAGDEVPELTRTELLVRLSALADDTRLSILKLVADQGELRSQDIIRLLDLSQSGASRQLQQLAAAGFLTERRCNGAKCYQLNSDRIDNTLQALGSFLAAQVEPAEYASSGRAKGG